MSMFYHRNSALLDCEQRNGIVAFRLGLSPFYSVLIKSSYLEIESFTEDID